MFTQKDKIAKLQRLVKQIDEWNSQRDLPPIFRIGNPALSIGSSEFQEWQGRVTAVIALIFGEHSHYIDDFNETSYTDIFAQLSRISGAPETKLWNGLAQAKNCFKQ